MAERKGRKIVQTKSQAKSSGIILPEVHGVDKGIDPNIQTRKTGYKAYNIFWSKRHDSKQNLG